MTCKLRYAAVERVPLIRFPLFVAMTVHTKLYTNMHVELHASARQDRDHAC